MSENKKIQIFKSLTPLEASNLIKKHADNQELIILDVRTPWEYSKEHIKDAENLDFSDPDFNEMVEKLDKDKIYVIYCKSGHRSDKVMEILKNLGFIEIYSIKNGFEGWKAEEMNIEQ